MLLLLFTLGLAEDDEEEEEEAAADASLFFPSLPSARRRHVRRRVWGAHACRR